MLKQLVTKYIKNTEHVFKEMQIPQTPRQLDEEEVKTVVDLARLYLKDAKFYRERSRFETALASVAYCEGLLDALRLLGMAEFRWPTRSGKEKLC